MAENCWLYLTDDSMPDIKKIKKESFLHEVGAMLETVRQYALKYPLPNNSAEQDELSQEVMIEISTEANIYTKRQGSHDNPDITTHDFTEGAKFGYVLANRLSRKEDKKED